MLETVRQYGLEKLGESSEADAVRTRHQDHYTAMALAFESTTRVDHEQLLSRAELNIDNLRSAFIWSRERGDADGALRLASVLTPLWLARGHLKEALAWFDAAADDQKRNNCEISPAVRVRAVVDRALLDVWAGFPGHIDEVDQTLAVARELGDPLLLSRALVARAFVAGYDDELARPYLIEASDHARAIGDGWRLGQTLAWRAYVQTVAGDPIAVRAAAEEGRAIADAIGDRFTSRACRGWHGWAYLGSGELQMASSQLREIFAEAEEAHDLNWQFSSLRVLIHAKAYQGDEQGYRATAEAAAKFADELGGFYPGVCQGSIAAASLSAADMESAAKTGTAAQEQLTMAPRQVAAVWLYPMAEVALARGDLLEARRWADEAVSLTAGWHLSLALMTRARVSIADKNPGSAERDLHQALHSAAQVDAYLVVPDLLECLARVAGGDGDHRHAARLCAAAEAIRDRTGVVRFKIYDADHEATVAVSRDALGDNASDDAWTEGAEVSPS
jgi:hypothetical protein